MSSELPDILFGSAQAAESKRLNRLLKAGRIRKLLPRVYTSDLQGSDANIIRRNLWKLLAFRFPDAVVSHRTALEFGPSPAEQIYLTSSEDRVVRWPGVTIRSVQGPGPFLTDRRVFEGGIAVASEERALLENLSEARTIGGEKRVLDRVGIEQRLLTILNTRGEDDLNRIRDTARNMAPELGLINESGELSAIISALLSTRQATGLSSNAARSYAAGEPYDTARLATLHSLITTLATNAFALRPERTPTEESFGHMAFFESYFSNYIEGTVFHVAEAVDIVYHNAKIPNRTGDSHDIRGTYRLCASREEMARIPANGSEFITRLKQRHAVLLAGRPEMEPGQFKTIPNRVGSSFFVDPGQVIGTLKQGYALVNLLTEPLARAIYVMFLVSEVHPFNDGNGRIARVMMNAELVAQGRTKLIIPNVYREDYMLALRKLTRQQDAVPYIRTMDRAHGWSHWLDPASWDGLHQQITASNGYKEPDEASLVWV